jgi:hypothetical protein
LLLGLLRERWGLSGQFEGVFSFVRALNGV